MKAKPDYSNVTIPSSNQSQGSALVLVLGFLVLITALVIAFFSSVTTEVSGAKQYAAGASAKQLADSAVQVVMGNITLATSGTTTSGSTAAWASQPGMIRTYDSAGNAVACYKLYSSDALILATGTTFDPGTDLDASWAAKPALFTDLNSPATSGTAVVFPIVDGNSIVPLSKTSSGTYSTTTGTYLGYDANGDGLPDVEGFAIDPAKVTYSSTAPLSPTNTPVPMPVKWIYVLKDGTLTAPDPTSGTIATFNNAPAQKCPSSTNPIVGRIAFWADDDTSKVNINTASAGTYWDTPTSRAVEDGSYAVYQPVSNEFQRYPGHPATTSLWPVFPTFWLGATTPAQIDVVNEQIYAMIPRVGGGGSMGGTALTTGTSMTSGSVPIALDKDRLFATVDELMFSGSTRQQQSLMTAPLLERSRFFLTANNRSPDVNLFNKPRICIWPIASTSGTAYRTAYDNVFAFCATSGSNATSGTGNAYYFQRSNNDSPTVDLPNTGSYTGLGRNRMLLDYLHYLTSQPIPGFGGTFQNKYSTSGTGTGTDCDQILTEIFDYIRIVNTNDSGVSKPFAPLYSSSYIGQSQVVPITDGVRGTRGFGRFPAIDKAFFMFIGNAQNPVPGASFVNLNGSTVANPMRIPATPQVSDMNFYNASTNPTGVVYGKMRVQAGFFTNFFVPAYGNISLYPKFKIQVDGLNNITWGPITTGSINATLPMGSGSTAGTVISVQTPVSGRPNATFPTSGTYANGTLFAQVLTTSGVTMGGPWWSEQSPLSFVAGGNLGFSLFYGGSGWTGAYSAGQSSPFWATTSGTSVIVSGTPTVTTNDLDVGGRFYFSGGTVTYKLYSASGTTVVQTGTIAFPPSPAGGWPVPTLAPSTVAEGMNPYLYDSAGNCRFFVTGTTPLTGITTVAPLSNGLPNNVGYGGRLDSVGTGVAAFHQPEAYIMDCDVVESVECASGDPRLIAGLNTVPASRYAPHALYNSGVNMAHDLRTSSDYPYYGATAGRLVNLAMNNLSTTAKNYTANGQWVATGSNNSNYDFNTEAWDWGVPVPSTGQTGPGVLLGGTSGTNTVLGDWDNGYGNTADGPYINKPDEGDASFGAFSTGNPYFEWGYGAYGAQQTMFSPNRQIPSAVMFGSLPTGIFANKPWQTLLFRPLPTGHPGLGISVSTGTTDVGPPYSIPPDHLFLDLFSMPVVEPYPISEPLSTSGRINMNYQIAPFTYITRSTGVRAVLASEQVIAIADSLSTSYKGGSGSISIRFPVNVEETLKGFSARFNNNDLFRSPSEICSINLVPLDQNDPNATYANMPAYWWQTGAYSTGTSHRLTGDNNRERPYATIYPRLTTKSNTFTVHFRVQTLKKVPTSGPANWIEGQDLVTSEYRGSQTIERYIDAIDPRIPDYADVTNAASNTPIDTFYKFRVLGSKKFAP